MHANSRSASFGLISAFALGCGSGGVKADSGDGDSSGVGSASASDDEETGVSASATVTASASASAEGTGTESDDGNDDGPPPIKLDVLGVPDVPGLGECGGNGGKGGGGGGNEPDFSFIWVANSIESTVSKINTQTMEEEGRYATRDTPNGSPSRTSVSLNGDVAIANRSGGVVKIYAHIDSCDDPGNTSTGAADVKPFPDGCVAWYTPFAYQSQRPVAWAPGDWNNVTCQYENEKLWTSGANASIDVLLLDGDTGEVEQTIPIPGVQPSYFGIYGGAVDADGNFWGTMLGGPSMIFVDRNSFDHVVYPMANNGGYGMTVDEEGRPWSCSNGVARFDPVNESWDVNPNVGGGGGCMADGKGHLWIGGYAGGGGNMIGIDTETLDVVYTIPIPHYVHGISVDFYGYVWGVTHSQPFAYRVDVENESFETFTGLNGPYTYSDMTGWALSNAVGPPPSG
jgi:hypothetical protein